RDLGAGANVDDLADGLVAGADLDEAGGGVLDVGEVARGLERAKPQRLAGERLRDDRRDDGARGLARAVGGEGAHDRDRERERALEALAESVGGDLRRGVGRLR